MKEISFNIYPRIYSSSPFLYYYCRYFSLGNGIIGKTAVINEAHSGTAGAITGSHVIGGNNIDSVDFFGDSKRVLGENTLIDGSYNNSRGKDTTGKMHHGSNANALNISHLAASFQNTTGASLDNSNFFSSSGTVVSNNYSLNNGSDSTGGVNSNGNSLLNDKYRGIGSIINDISEGKFLVIPFSDTLGEPCKW